MAKERRCNLFDDHGRPRRLKDGTKGCFRDASVCRFAHPHEREWETAYPSHPPRHDNVIDADSDFFYILSTSDRRDREKEKWERDRERERDKKPSSLFRFGDSPTHRRDSAAITSPGPPSRKSTLDSGVDGGGATKRARSPALSSTSDQLELLRKDSTYRTKDLLLLRQDHAPSSSRRSRSHSKDEEKERRRADLTSQSPLVESYIPDAVVPVAQPTPNVPPEPLEPLPMQPPPPPPQLPPIPELPSFASNEQSNSPAETALKGLRKLSMDEQRSAWHERIDLMFSSIASRRDYSKLNSDLRQIDLLTESSLVDNMPEADRVKLKTQRTDLESKATSKRIEVNEIIEKLVGSAFWPVLRTPQISEMENTVGEAKKHVLEVRSLLEDVKDSYAALFKTSGSDWSQESERPSKRRKLEQKTDAPRQSTTGDAEDVTEESAKELEAFRDRLAELDRHLVDLENDITQRDRIISDEIELQVDARLEAEDALYTPARELTEVSQAEIEAVVGARNRELVRAVTTTSEDIGALATEVAELITKVNVLEARCKTLEAENHEFKSKLAQNTLNHAKCQDALERRDKEIEAIAAALQAYISQAPGSQTVDEFPSAEYIIGALDSQLNGLFREKFHTTLVSIQKDVFDKVEESHTRTMNIVSPKIISLIKMVGLVRARLGGPDVESVHTG